MTTEEKVLAWHFVKEDGALSHDMNHVKVAAGLELEVDEDKLGLCTYGLHASIKPLDALKYAPGATVCRVELSGRILHGADKLVASRRRVIAVADATHTLYEFALWCAEQALTLIDDPDPRSIEALRVKRLWIDGEATDDELAAAWDAASAAARGAARDAASAAARATAWGAARAAARAAASVAAWDAASAAAWAAASAAAWAAAWAAASAVAWDAASAAASAAAWAAQNAKLESMLDDLFVEVK